VVPNVIGMTVADAYVVLQKKGFTVQWTPAVPGQLPQRARIRGQTPKPGTTWSKKEPVNVFTPVPKPKPTKVEPLKGLTLDEALAAVAAAGFSAQAVPRYDASQPPGTIVGQIPSAATALKPGTTVQVVVSAGFPAIVFSNGKDILVMNGADGSNPKPVATTPDLEDEPSWQPHGSLIAYRRGPASNGNAGKIWITGVNGTPRPRALTGGPDDRRPSFSPDGKVVAYSGASGSGADHDLCFVRVAAAGPAGACKGDPTTIVDRPAWSPDGKTILAVARDSANPDQGSKLVEYTSDVPNSSRPSDWEQRPIPATDAQSQPGKAVLFAAFAPDGKQVAIVANWADPQLAQVFLGPWTATGLGPPAPLSPPLRACTAAWRPDSRELVVMVSQNCGTGDIQRVDPTKPAEITTLRSQDGRDPAWEPLTPSSG
jgi:dipeptidyl aminopeptidase/acylaminoacyl peptidase